MALTAGPFPNTPKLLGIEGGGTCTVALFVQGEQVQRWEGGPANLHLLTDEQLTELLREVARQFPRPDALAIGLPGARLESDRERIRRAAAECWPAVPCLATNDLETALAAQPARQPLPRVLVLSGTGSCCYGQTEGRGVRTGGWGHLLGDWGSAYWIAVTALRQTLAIYDHTRRWPALGARFLTRLNLNVPEDLIDWAKTATKDQMAALAVTVFDAANAGDRHAEAVLREAAEHLASDAAACARRIARPRSAVEFILAGGTLLKQPRFAARVSREIRARWPQAKVVKLSRESAWGAVELAARLARLPKAPCLRNNNAASIKLNPLLSPTEEPNPRSRHLDELPLSRAIDLMLSEEQRTPAAVRAARRDLEETIRRVVRAFRRGGRLFYVGAGTSGRLGILDASECPPTFSVPAEMVQGIMAGGAPAVFQAVEGAEDDEAAGRQAMVGRGITAKDVVIGIASSGRTPFVLSALCQARKLGAYTVLLHCNPRLQLPEEKQPHRFICLPTGPEVLTGSTRLKAGTATKLALNLISTLSMVRLGKVLGHWMVDMRPTNSKLRARAVRIVSHLTGAPPEQAQAALEAEDWNIREVVRRLGRRRPAHEREAR
ncbi:N-acetylmuramic acid 6-phosphate etherase [Fontisphaera persica]|uniref:N-acetylmuramic acid 6-phosphate etherase n=1 Tax=Fontisphaera persica TaxID=2974023 RepID=UPI0024BFBD07|nr:N-acetylmuramic acid 6-phosphate etherase [Fontisphaera persica]WCJ60165.1 N-acetylmuramic acid 6-phosphate etherase [Fontisphaera persica]